ncbi:MAG: hypothetical protein JO327_02210 [Nitrososphaeraceae archaeon]|nr:hypothetical protein [Nitrososphaeraceae archaeon]MBV9666925.1 hypothetical protein [Nitrososphaeraceae archaeon]
MLSCSSFFRSSSDLLEDTILLYKRVTEQYKDEKILAVVKSLIPDNVILQTKKEDEDNIVSILKWFKNDFMKWTPKDPSCEKCFNANDYSSSGGGNRGNGDVNNIDSSGRSSSAAVVAVLLMQSQVIMGNSWKMRKTEVFKCNNCNYEYAFPRYAEILKIAEIKRGRCSEWSMLFGAMLNSLDIEARIVHDFLDHCWNEAKVMPGGKWIHVDSTLTYPISLNHPYYYEGNWGKKYEYVLAFSADKMEDVTQRYTQHWETLQQRRQKKRNSNKKNAKITNLAKFYSDL